MRAWECWDSRRRVRSEEEVGRAGPMGRLGWFVVVVVVDGAGVGPS